MIILVAEENLEFAVETVKRRNRRMSPVSLKSNSGIVDLSSLSQRVITCSLRMEDLPRCTNAILRSFFYRSDEIKSSFSSFCVVQNRVSLIIHADLVPYFPPNLLDMHGVGWKIIQIAKGCVQVSEGELSREISDILMRARIPFTWIAVNAGDFVLIEQDCIDRALQCLQDSQSVAMDRSGT